MTQVCIFTNDNAGALQAAINAFIANKRVVDIKFNSVVYETRYVSGVPTQINCNDRVMVIYEED